MKEVLKSEQAILSHDDFVTYIMQHGNHSLKFINKFLSSKVLSTGFKDLVAIGDESNDKYVCIEANSTNSKQITPRMLLKVPKRPQYALSLLVEWELIKNRLNPECQNVILQPLSFVFSLDKTPLSYVVFEYSQKSTFLFDFLIDHTQQFLLYEFRQKFALMILQAISRIHEQNYTHNNITMFSIVVDHYLMECKFTDFTEAKPAD